MSSKLNAINELELKEMEIHRQFLRFKTGQFLIQLTKKLNPPKTKNKKTPIPDNHIDLKEKN